MILLTQIVRFLKLATVVLHESHLLQCFCALPFQYVMQRREHRHHALDILFTKVQARRLLQRLMPRLVPDDGDANELKRHHLRLLYEQRTVLPNVVQDRDGRRATRRTLAFARHEQWIQHRLWMLSTDAHEKLVNQVAYRYDLCVDSCDNLRNHCQPSVDVHVTKTFDQRGFDFRIGAVVEPQREKAQNVLQRAALARRRATKSN
mmetsp:Transcript_8693/g.19663  ORF Transcript_8693/g.19663 Transcript_8693/m.19663 type:complete len:205 (-) Transcript_8693:5297-5911(-)